MYLKQVLSVLTMSQITNDKKTFYQDHNKKMVRYLDKAKNINY